MNNKKIALGLVGLGVAAYLGSVYIVNKDDRDLAARQIAQYSHLDPQSLNFQAKKIMSDKGCGYCHTSDSEMPFYSEWPIAKNLMEADVRVGLRHFDINKLYRNLQNQEPISEVALARIEKVLYDDSMPPKIYQSMHWAAGISKEEKHTLLKWIRESRAERHQDSPVTAERKQRAL